MLYMFQVDMFPQFSSNMVQSVLFGMASRVDESQKIVPLTNIEVAEDEYANLGC